MTTHHLLSDEEFHRYFGEGMTNVTGSQSAEIDIWGYVDSIGPCDLADLAPTDVSSVYRHPDGQWEHVIIDTSVADVQLVLVIDRVAPAIVGHHLLNLNKKYGLSEH